MTDGVFFVRSGIEDDPLVLVKAAWSCAVLSSGLPATLLRTPSKTLGASRGCVEGCDSSLVEAATALIYIIPTTNMILAC